MPAKILIGIRKICRSFILSLNRIIQQEDKRCYLKSARKPWTRGYQAAKFSNIADILADQSLMGKFKNDEILDDGFGWAYDERIVEYPWLVSRLSSKPGRLLDAGSALNFKELVNHPKIVSKDLTIFTLAPEEEAFWAKKISYCYGDLRSIPFMDGWFDEICSISTLGHVGMDCRIYDNSQKQINPIPEAGKAVKELLRVLKPGGKLFITVCFGKRQEIEWNGTVFALQFDSILLDELMVLFRACSHTKKTFFKYSGNGWNISTERDCQGLEYYNIHSGKAIGADFAAAARSVACIEICK